MKELTGLLEQLAEKLGTTTEYLWGVLITQAKVSAIIDLMYIVLVSIIGVIIWKVHKHLMKKDADGDTKYYDLEELAIVPMVIVSIIWGVLFVVCFFSLGNIISGFVNPDYWALEQVLDIVK